MLSQFYPPITGFLVSPGVSQALREAIQCLLDDPGKRERMGCMAKQRVVEYQAKKGVARIERVYQEQLEGGSIDTPKYAHGTNSKRVNHDEASI